MLEAIRKESLLPLLNYSVFYVFSLLLWDCITVQAQHCNVHIFENMLSKYFCNNTAGAHTCTKSAVFAPLRYLPLASLSGDNAVMLLLEISHPALFTDRCHIILDFYFELSTTGGGFTLVCAAHTGLWGTLCKQRKAESNLKMNIAYPVKSICQKMLTSCFLRTVE